MFHSRIKDINLFSDSYSILSYEIDLTQSNVYDYELKERMFKAFEVYSLFELKFSIE